MGFPKQKAREKVQLKVSNYKRIKYGNWQKKTKVVTEIANHLNQVFFSKLGVFNCEHVPRKTKENTNAVFDFRCVTRKEILEELDNSPLNKSQGPMVYKLFAFNKLNLLSDFSITHLQFAINEIIIQVSVIPQKSIYHHPCLQKR